MVVPVSRLKLILKPLLLHPPQLLVENWVRQRPDILLTLSLLLLAWRCLAPQNKVQQFPSISASCDSEHCSFPSSLFWLWRQKTDSGHGWFFLPPPPPPAARWQQSKAGALQHHGIKSAFYKPALDGSKLAKKRESPGGRESLQDRLVEALESSRCQKVISGVLLTFFQATILGTSKDIFSSFWPIFCFRVACWSLGFF